MGHVLAVGAGQAGQVASGGGYPDAAPDRGYSPLVALMPAMAPEGENPAGADQPPVPRASRARAEAERRWRA